MSNCSFTITNLENQKIQAELSQEAQELSPPVENPDLRKRFNNWKKTTEGKECVKDMLRKQAYICPSCMQSLSDKFHVHHLTPISKLTEKTAWMAISTSNLVVLCPSCNLKQSNKIDVRFD